MSTLPQDDLRQTVQKKMYEKARAGYLLGCPPVGYLNRRRGKKITVEIDPVTAPLVQKTFALVAEGTHSLRELAEDLSTLGLTVERQLSFPSGDN